jgi:hypothetical protein
MCNTSYGQMKGWESNWQFDLWPWKVMNRPNSIVCRWRAKCRWEDLDEGYNFGLNLILIGGLHKKLWTHKVARIPTLAISGLSLGSPGTKSHSDATLAGRCKVYYMGEGHGFPQVQAVVSLMSPRLPVVCPTPKVLQLVLANLLVDLVQVYVSEWNCLSLFLVPSQSSGTPLYLFKVLRAKERALSSQPFRCFTPRFIYQGAWEHVSKNNLE